MPRANTAILDRLPPVKVLTNPKIVFDCCCMNSRRAWGSMPGVGMWQPTR